MKNRLALQYVKTTAAHDTKRKERENTTATSKFSSSNSSTMAASANQGRVPMPSPDGERVLLETALEDLEGIRQALLSENEQFRIGMANSVQSAEDAVRAAGATPRSLGDLVPDVRIFLLACLAALLSSNAITNNIDWSVSRASLHIAAPHPGSTSPEPARPSAVASRGYRRGQTTSRTRGHDSRAQSQLRANQRTQAYC